MVVAVFIYLKIPFWGSEDTVWTTGPNGKKRHRFHIKRCSVDGASLRWIHDNPACQLIEATRSNRFWQVWPPRVCAWGKGLMLAVAFAFHTQVRLWRWDGERAAFKLQEWWHGRNPWLVRMSAVTYWEFRRAAESKEHPPPPPRREPQSKWWHIRKAFMTMKGKKRLDTLRKWSAAAHQGGHLAENTSEEQVRISIVKERGRKQKSF